MLSFYMMPYAEPRSIAQHSRRSEHAMRDAHRARPDFVGERPPGAEGFLSIVFPTDPCPLITAHSCLKSFSYNTCESPRKCCKQKTYALAKPFRCNTYKIQGECPSAPVPQRSDVLTFRRSPSVEARMHLRAIIGLAASPSAMKASQE